MIGSLMSRMADAEKLSVAQLNQAVKNGTIPAYVGVPLIQEKLKAEQAAKAMVAQTQAQPPIARQVMEQADMMSGLEKLRSNLPEEGFAGGGIVAFAEGGETPPTQPTMSIAPPKGYTFDQASGQYDPVEQRRPGLAGILDTVTGSEGILARILGRARGYAEGGEVDGYAAGGKTMLPQFQSLSDSQPIQQGFVNPRGVMSPEMQAYYEKDFADQRERAERMQGLFGAQPLLPDRPTPQVAATPIAQPTGQSTFPGATSMQGGFGQGAPGYPSFTMGSGGFGGGGGAGGAFPLEGRYGIVKMAEGGVATPDDDEDEEKGLMSRLMAGITSLKSGMPESYEAELAKKGQTPASARKLMIDGPKKGDYVMPPLDSQRPSGEGIMQRRGGHKYEDLVIREAERIGLDPNMAIHVLYKETGNLKNPETVRSKAGAIGVMQLMPKTAKSLGVDPLDPEQNIRGGVAYLKQMYDKYQDPTLAYAAYNAGPGRVDKALRSGQGIASLPRETQNYIRMAGGGIVAFQNTGLVSGEFGGDSGAAAPSLTPRQFDEEQEFDIDPMTGQKLFSGYTRPKRTTAPTTKTAPAVPTVKTSTDEDSGPYIGGQAPAAAPAAPEPYKEPPPDSGLSDIKNLLKQRMEESGKQKRIDAYLSLLQTGLGMMGGTSPFAAVNIGQGASQGVAAQLAARKSQVADENAILTGQLGLSRAELYEKMRRDALRQKAGEAASLAEYRQGQLTLGAGRTKALEAKNYLTAQKQFVEQGGRDDLNKQFVEKYGKNWKVDPRLLYSYNQMERQRIRDLMTIGSGED